MTGWLVALVALAALAAALWWWLFRMALPQVSGTLTAPGLGAPVEVVRDKWGIPHIYAQSLADAAYGLGWCHAQDRLWQMELNRRIGAGRLSEFVGPLALEADRLLRRLGLRRAAEAESAHLDPAEQSVAEAYCRGVNAAVARMGSRLPLEFRLLGIRPQPWTPADILSWGKVMSLFLSLNWEEELLRYKLAQQVGPERAARLETHYPAGQPVITAPGGEGAADVAAELLRLMGAARAFLPLGTAGASNNWVVSGSRTATGKPLLANDPHLQLTVPSIWYEAHLVCPETEVTGCTFPGVPMVIIGHNQHVGWGFTNSFVDVADLYLEKWHPSEAACEFEGRWEPAQVRQEIIRVKGGPDVTETVYVTRHGPVLAGGPLGPGPALALRWAGLDPGHFIRAFIGMNTAGDAAAFRLALRDFPTPSQNIVFADTAGNIGYVMAGLAPIRRKGTGLTPVPGWTGAYEWTGWVPFDELPQLWNPPAGYIVTANNKVVEADYPHHISWDFMPGYRAQRIAELLTARPALTPQDFRNIQMDVCCAPGREFAAHCRALAPADPMQQRALAALLEWDGHLHPDTVGGTVYEVMLHHAVRRAYEPLMGPELLELWLGKSNVLVAPANNTVGRSTTALLRELAARDPAFFAPPAAAAVAAAAAPVAGGSGADPWDQLLAASLAEATAYLSRTLGPDPAAWQWGRLHRLPMNHALGAVKLLRPIFNGPVVPVGGDAATPHATGYIPHQPYMASAFGPSYRHILDFADLTRSQSVHPGGQSGHPRSRHYMDLFPLWCRGEYHPMLFTRAAVDQHAEASLRLTPGEV